MGCDLSINFIHAHLVQTSALGVCLQRLQSLDRLGGSIDCHIAKLHFGAVALPAFATATVAPVAITTSSLRHGSEC